MSVGTFSTIKTVFGMTLVVLLVSYEPSHSRDSQYDKIVYDFPKCKADMSLEELKKKVELLESEAPVFKQLEEAVAQIKGARIRLQKAFEKEDTSAACELSLPVLKEHIIERPKNVMPILENIFVNCKTSYCRSMGKAALYELKHGYELVVEGCSAWFFKDDLKWGIHQIFMSNHRLNMSQLDHKDRKSECKHHYAYKKYSSHSITPKSVRPSKRQKSKRPVR